MRVITILSQACNTVRRTLSRAEQSMLIDIFNGTILAPRMLGTHLVPQVEDSFDLYPGYYEEKWGVSKQELLAKVKGLTQQQATLLELWAVGFWALGEASTTRYLDGEVSLEVYAEGIVSELDKAVKGLEGTKGAFKSAAVANARRQVEEGAERLRRLL